MSGDSGPPVAELLPWHAEAWARIDSSIRQDRLGHGLLVSGPQGVGKGRFVGLLVRRLLCESALGPPCGTCLPCRLASAGTHPDLVQVAPPGEGREIRVEMIREACESLSLSAGRAGRKVAILWQAERMNRHAANSLLKTLEEPTPETYLVLVTDRPHLLPATVRSRCQQTRLQLPDSETALRWLRGHSPHAHPELLLALSGGAPLPAAAIAEEGGLEERLTTFRELLDVVRGRADPVRIASVWSGGDAPRRIRWVLSWAADMIRLRVCAGAAHLRNPDFEKELEQLAAGCGLEELFRRYDELCNALQWLGTPVNAQGVMECVLIAWSQSTRLKN